jgi:hypothetical protein
VEDQRRQDREQLIRSLGAGFLVRWDQHDPEAVEQEVGPVALERTEERELAEAWFG